jgi:hypothetical protein
MLLQVESHDITAPDKAVVAAKDKPEEGEAVLVGAMGCM